MGGGGREREREREGRNGKTERNVGRIRGRRRRGGNRPFIFVNPEGRGVSPQLSKVGRREGETSNGRRESKGWKRGRRSFLRRAGKRVRHVYMEEKGGKRESDE
jgi:hypothetical protein